MIRIHIVGLLLFNFYTIIESCARTGSVDTTTVAVTTTAATTTTVAPCVAATGEVGLTRATGTTSLQTGQEQTATAMCTSCTQGTREFFTGFTATDDPNDALANNAASGTFQCQDPTMLCVCDSSGNCCQPEAGQEPPFVQVVPYCAAGVCRNNLFFPTAVGSFTCDSGVGFDVLDQYEGNGVDLEPMNTAAYFNVDSVSCSGCTPLRSNTCTGPRVAAG